MKRILLGATILAAAYGLWVGLSVTDILPSNLRWTGITGEYGALLRRGN